MRIYPPPVDRPPIVSLPDEYVETYRRYRTNLRQAGAYDSLCPDEVVRMFAFLAAGIPNASRRPTIGFLSVRMVYVR
mgnify:CR=1 FL=1